MRPSQRWHGLIVVLHAVNAALIVILLATGLAMAHGMLSAPSTFATYQFHKALGFIVAVVTIVKLIGRAGTKAPTPVAGVEGRVSRGAQAGLYALSLIAVAAGWLVVSASPLPLPTSIFGLFVVPNIASPDAGLFAFAARGHRYGAYALAALLGLHMLGAAKHQWIDRDGTLARMFRLW